MAKTARQLIESVRLNLFEYERIRYVRGTTTSAGATDGTTAIDSNLSSYLNDHFNGAFFRILEGAAARHKELLITDFASATGTVTLAASADNIGHQIASGTDYEIYDKGIWTDIQILEWLNTELARLPQLLPDGAIVHLIKKDTTAGTAGVASLPPDMLKFITLEVGGVVAGLLPPKDKNRFANDAFLPATTNRPLAIFSGASAVDGNNLYARIEYRPANNATLTWTYIPKIPDVAQADSAGAGAQTLQMPDHYADLLVLGATIRAFTASEDFSSASAFRSIYNERLQAIGASQAGKTKVEEK